MILADAFKNSEIARHMDFTTAVEDNPVIVQFAACKASDLADAAEFVYPYCQGIDINCGCPQKWAIKEGIGAAMMSKPELMVDMLSQVRQRVPASFPCSIKIRIHKDLKETVEYARRAEAVGCSSITVHGRTKSMKSSEPVDMEAIKIIKSSVSIPVYANGDIFSLKDADECVALTGVDGVMSARGLLENPALFAGYEQTPLECIERFVNLSVDYGSNHFIFHHHLMYMMDNLMTKPGRS